MKSFKERFVFTISCLLIITSGLHAADEAKTKAESTEKTLAAVHPVVPGFERFFIDSESDIATAGRLLLGELNCTSCHLAEKSIASTIEAKKAPILDNVGSRIKPEYLLKFLESPHRVKPGTTMPNLFAALPEKEKQEQTEAIAHFLASTGSIGDVIPDQAAAKRGDVLFHQIGCTACHNPRRENSEQLPTSVPLGDPSEKYSLTSLIQFLRDPHKVRPSGRMPNLNLDQKQARDIANFFFRAAKIPTNMIFAYFEGSWEEVPDFKTMKPKATGQSAGFDLNPASRKSNFGMRFSGFLHLPRDGEYTFWLGSDDGSKLYIDDKLVVNNDGIHPHSEKNGKLKLSAGAHSIAVDYFQGGGEWTLKVAVQGPGVGRQPAANLITPTSAPAEKSEGDTAKGFTLDPTLVEKGRKLFTTVGCASCHELREKGQLIKSEAKAKPLAELKPDLGCLAETVTQKNPNFSLTRRQRESLSAVIQSTPEAAVSPKESLDQTLTAFNCYACHAREKKGGPEQARNTFFVGKIPEMGDEGRIPPPLDGAGDKLKENWLKHILTNGAKDRPYMLTRMPKFGTQNVGHIVVALKELDEKTEAEQPTFDLPEFRVQANARYLVGSKALSCIKCHYFDKHKATGIQAMDLTTMTQRLRQDWFQRYMLNPQPFRPGTRMPAAWPFGQATVKEILDADAHKQIAAIWMYLSKGKKAPIPAGLVSSPIELVPEKEPIIYRNFIEGVSPRGIAVGYPEKANLAFDADKMCLRLIWHGAFIDASKHWTGRGTGSQTPLGDHVLQLASSAPLSELESADSKWPEGSAKELGYRFRGYRLDANRRPIFQYNYKSIMIEDFPKPVPAKPDTQIERTITLKSSTTTNGIWYRAARGKAIESLGDGWYRVDREDGALKIFLKSGSSKAVVQSINGESELRIPVVFENEQAVIIQKYVW